MAKQRRKTFSAACLIGTLLCGLLWQFGPIQAVFAVVNLSDPDKLATLGERGANSRLNKIVYWMRISEERSLNPEKAIGIAQFLNRSTGARAHLVRESLLRNLKIAHGLGLFTEENKELLRNGKAGVVTQGPYARSKVEIDHIVPYSLAPEVGNELANLEMMPQPLNRSKSNRVGQRQVAHAEKLFAAGLLSKESLAKVRSRSAPLLPPNDPKPRPLRRP